MLIESEMILFDFGPEFLDLRARSKLIFHKVDPMPQEHESDSNPYRPPQTELLQPPCGVPSWLAKTWHNTKQYFEEPTPPVESWSGAMGQIYRWIVLFHVCNLLPVLALWKLCHRWRTFTLVFVVGLMFTAGFAFAGYSIMVFVSEHVTWTIK